MTDTDAELTIAIIKYLRNTESLYSAEAMLLLQKIIKSY